MRVWILEHTPDCEPGTRHGVYASVADAKNEFNKRVMRLLDNEGRTTALCRVDENTGETYVQNGYGDRVSLTPETVQGLTARNGRVPVNALVTMVQVAVFLVWGVQPTNFDGKVWTHADTVRNA